MSMMEYDITVCEIERLFQFSAFFVTRVNPAIVATAINLDIWRIFVTLQPVSTVIRPATFLLIVLNPPCAIFANLLSIAPNTAHILGHAPSLQTVQLELPPIILQLAHSRIILVLELM